MRLFVYKEDMMAGELFTSDAGVCFKYSQDYRGPTAYPLSLSLPVRAEAFPQSAALPFFEGLLPEGEQRRELSNLLHVSPTSTMKLLRALAGECVGNLVILDEEMEIADIVRESAYVPLDSRELEALLRPQSTERMRFIANRRLSLAGAQPKIGLYYGQGEWFAAKGLASTTHIVKPASLFDPSLLINEFFAMRLAKGCDIEVPKTDIIRCKDHYGFVVERFDRKRLAEKIVRLGQEDFCQALSVMPDAKYENDGGPGFKQLFATALHHTSRPLQNIQRLLRLVLFNYLTGNCDAHAKNFSLLQDPDSGLLSLAPAYDLVCTTFYGDRLSRSMAMRIGGHSRIDSISTEDFALFSKETGISLEAIAAEMRSLCDSITEQLDRTVEAVGQEAEGFLPVAKQLREHHLRELGQRIML
jgi:serine/threonine-protein kinase HipA